MKHDSFLPAADIPLESLVTKRGGEKPYTLRKYILVAREARTGDMAGRTDVVEPSGNGRLLVARNGDANEIGIDKVLCVPGARPELPAHPTKLVVVRPAQQIPVDSVVSEPGSDRIYTLRERIRIFSDGGKAQVVVPEPGCLFLVVNNGDAKEIVDETPLYWHASREEIIRLLKAEDEIDLAAAMPAPEGGRYLSS